MVSRTRRLDQLVHPPIFVNFIATLNQLTDISLQRWANSRYNRDMPFPSLVSPVCLLVTTLSCVALYAGARATAAVRTGRFVSTGVVTLAALALSLAANPANLIVSDLLVVMMGLLGGVLIGRHIVTRKVLAVAVTCAAAADCASFFFGPTHFVMRQAAGIGAEPLIAYLSVSVPIHAHLYSVIGLGDLWIFTACVSAALKLGWPRQAALLVPLAGILAAVAAGTIFGALPALPFLAAAVLVYQALLNKTRSNQPNPSRPACRV